MLDLRSLRLDVGDQRREPVTVHARPFTVGGVEYGAVPAELPATVVLTRTRTGLVLELELAADVHGPCHRCLEDAHVDVRIDATEYQADAPEPGAEVEETCEYLADGLLDTDRWAADALVLAMPQKVLCRESCAGLCPTCGADLNAGPCGCPADEGDPRLAVLRTLRRDS